LPRHNSIGAPMSAYNHAYSLTSGRAAGVRSFSVIAATIAAVCLLSGTPVVRELVGSPPARATTAATARTWDLQPRWWPGEVRSAAVRSAEVKPAEAQPGEARQLSRQTSTVPDSDLTFTKGYSLRLAARQATSAPRLAASEPASETQSGRAAVVVRKVTFARTDLTPGQRRVSTAQFDARVDRPAPADLGGHALAFGEQRPSPRGFVEPPGGPFGNLFANFH